MTRVHLRSAGRAVVVVIFGFLLLARPADAGLITLDFTGVADSTVLSGLADKPYSGFFTWDSSTAPDDVDGTSVAQYLFADHELILDGVDIPGLGGMFMFNDVDFFGTGVAYGLAILAQIDSFLDGSTPVDRFFIAALVGGTDTWDGVQPLPGDLSFLPKLSTRFAAFVDEYPGGDDEDVFLGVGTLTITRASVPEPATLTLTVLGLGTLVTRIRRSRRSKS